MTYHGIEINGEKVAEFCRRHGIKRLSLFGSIVRGDFVSESDVDVLVEFRPEARVSLFDMAGMQEELTELIGRRVDLRTAGDLSRYFRDDVVLRAREIYAA